MNHETGEKGMGQYTPEQVEASTVVLESRGCYEQASMLRAYAATLRQQAARVDEGMVERAVDARIRLLSEKGRDNVSDNELARAALEAALQAQPTAIPQARMDDGIAARIADETMAAWGDRVPKYSFDFRGLIADGIRRAALSAQPAERQGEGSLYVEARQCEDCDHLGINDGSDTNSACGDCEWQGPTPDEDKCPGCGHENCMAVACPECGGRYRFLADHRFTHPAAPVGVPDGWRETILSVLSALDTATGDTDPNIDPDMTDDDVRGEYPEVWAMQQLSGLLAAAPSAPQGTQQGEG